MNSKRYDVSEVNEDIVNEKDFDPREYHKWRWRAIAIWVVVFTAITFYSLHHSSQAIDAAANASVARCQDSRELTTNVILRSIESNAADWRRNPEKVLSQYRQFLNGFDVYTEDQLDNQVARTRDILELSDPTKCASPSSPDGPEHKP